MHTHKDNAKLLHYFLLAEYFAILFSLGLGVYVFFDCVGTGEAREVSYFLFLYCLPTTDLQ